MNITNEQWQRIAKFIPKPKAQLGKSGRPPQDPRNVLNGILWILRTGVQWADLPDRYPPKSTCHLTLVENTLDACFLENVPEKIIGDMAYDSDPLDKCLSDERGVELIALPKKNRVKPTTQDGRVLRRYKKR